MKFCKNCKFMSFENNMAGPGGVYICNISTKTNTNLVTGEKRIVNRTCEGMRKDGFECGRSGKLFEIKEK